ncbi:MAG: hypothetical protein GVY06_01305 [Alphaproteobacteria bacterium]|jgi:hypothetical protein|nr:hypothetical protein [Alphaproteobacteria bacterium]
MTDRQILVVIDATRDTAFDATPDARPPVVDSLGSLDSVTGVHLAAPVILCAEPNAARARGAFLVSGDGDGTVIALDPVGTPQLRSALATSWRDLNAPQAELMILPAGAGLPADPPPFNPLTGGPALTLDAFETTPSKGVVQPPGQMWKSACAGE